MPTDRVSVVRTSTANLAAVVAAFERLGCVVDLTSDPDEVRHADRVILPGVGAFAAVRRAIGDEGLREALVSRIEYSRATLAICLGMQLLAEGSDEAPGVAGFGVLKGVARRYDADGQRVPQMGWNRVTPVDPNGIVPHGFAYFANSYRLTESTEGWNPGWTEYDGPFLSSIERGPVVACQFHPELSGAYGRRLLCNWLGR